MGINVMDDPGAFERFEREGGKTEGNVSVKDPLYLKSGIP